MVPGAGNSKPGKRVMREIPTSYHRQPPIVARGAKTRPCSKYTAVMCYLDPDTFQIIREKALAQGMSFSSIMRDIVEWGLMEEKR